MKCFFCHEALRDEKMVLFKTERFAVRFDSYPVAKGHLLIFPLRHVERLTDLTPGEWVELRGVMRRAEEALEERFHPDGMNWGVNQGEAAGQTVPHLHIHLIPRYRGDVPDPRGGVRRILPGVGSFRRGSGNPSAYPVPRPLYEYSHRVEVIIQYNNLRETVSEGCQRCVVLAIGEVHGDEEGSLKAQIHLDGCP